MAEPTVTGGWSNWRVWVGNTLVGTFSTLDEAWDAAKTAYRLSRLAGSPQ